MDYRKRLHWKYHLITRWQLCSAIELADLNAADFIDELTTVICHESKKLSMLPGEPQTFIFRGFGVQRYFTKHIPT